MERLTIRNADWAMNDVELLNCENCIRGLGVDNPPCADCKHERMAVEKLAAYEDAAAEGRLVVLPCRVGDKIYSFCWNIKSEKYEIHSSEIKNVRYDSADSYVIVSDGERYYAWGKTVFLARAEAEKALKACEADGKGGAV